MNAEQHEELSGIFASTDEPLEGQIFGQPRWLWPPFDPLHPMPRLAFKQPGALGVEPPHRGRSKAHLYIGALWFVVRALAVGAENDLRQCTQIACGIQLFRQTALALRIMRGPGRHYFQGAHQSAAIARGQQSDRT